MLDSTWGQGLNIGHPQLIIFKLCSPKMTILYHFMGLIHIFRHSPLVL